VITALSPTPVSPSAGTVTTASQFGGLAPPETIKDS